MQPTENIVAATIQPNIQTIGAVSFYPEDKQPIEPDIEKNKEFCEKVHIEKVVIGGNTNAWGIWWGITKENHRDEIVAGALVETGMETPNEGAAPTFCTSGGKKLNQGQQDVTACKSRMLGNKENSEIDKGTVSLNHNAINYATNFVKFIEVMKFNPTKIFNIKNDDDRQKRKTEFGKNLEKEKLDTEYIYNIDNIHTLKTVVNTYINNNNKKASKNLKPQIKKYIKLTLPCWPEVSSKLKNKFKCKHSPACICDHAAEELITRSMPYNENLDVKIQIKIIDSKIL